MIVRFRRGNMTETRPVHGKLDHHVSAGRKRDGYKQLPVSVEFTKYGNMFFRPVNLYVKERILFTRLLLSNDFKNSPPFLTSAIKLWIIHIFTSNRMIVC